MCGCGQKPTSAEQLDALERLHPFHGGIHGGGGRPRRLRAATWLGLLRPREYRTRRERGARVNPRACRSTPLHRAAHKQGILHRTELLQLSWCKLLDAYYLSFKILPSVLLTTPVPPLPLFVRAYSSPASLTR